MDSKKAKVSTLKGASKRCREVHDSSHTEYVKKAKVYKASKEVDRFDLGMFSKDDIRRVHVQVISQCKEVAFLVGKLSDEQKLEVSDIGFGSLLKLKEIDISNELYLPFLLNYNGGAMTFSNGKETVLINSGTISDVLGLPFTYENVLLEEVRKRDGRSSERQFWYDFLGVDGKSPYLKAEFWWKLFDKHKSGDQFKQLFVLFCVTFFLCPRSDFAPNVTCGRSLQNASDIAKYNWSGYIANSMCAGVKNFHQTLLKKKQGGALEVGKGRVNIKVTGCMFALVLAVIHKFKVRDMDYSRVTNPYIGFWKSEDLAKAVSVYGQNLKHAIVVSDASTSARKPVVIEESVACGSLLRLREGVCIDASTKDVPIAKKAALEEGSSGRELVLKLPSHLKTDEEINSLDIPEYSKKLMKVQRNMIAICELNIELARVVTAEAKELSQETMSQDDANDLEVNENFFTQINAICAKYFADKDLAGSLNVSEGPFVKKKPTFNTDVNETLLFEKDTASLGLSHSEKSPSVEDKNVYPNGNDDGNVVDDAIDGKDADGDNDDDQNKGETSDKESNKKKDDDQSGDGDGDRDEDDQDNKETVWL